MHREIAVKQKKTWRKPTIKELPITMEIAAYRCAVIKNDED